MRVAILTCEECENEGRFVHQCQFRVEREDIATKHVVRGSNGRVRIVCHFHFGLALFEKWAREQLSGSAPPAPSPTPRPGPFSVDGFVGE